MAGVHTQQVPSGAGTEYSIWGTSTVGTATAEGPGNASVVLGTKFRASVNGSVVGIRWQRVTNNNGVGDVALFQGTTNISGTRTVSGETASGWQRMDFASPISITSNTIYIAAARYILNLSQIINIYYSSSNYFTSAYINTPLEAVATATSVNGVYSYSSTMVAPSSTWQGSSYFIDLVFTY